MKNIIKVIEFEIEEPKLISINEQYIHPVRKTKSGRYMSYFAPSDFLKEVQEYYKKVLQEKITDEDINSLKEDIDDKNHGLYLQIILGIPFKDLRNDDASNFIKALEDCIVKRTGIDDSRHYAVSIEKQLYESETNIWILKVVLSKGSIENYIKL